VKHKGRNLHQTIANGRYLAEHIAGARFAALPGRDPFPFVEPSKRDIAFGEIEGFLAGLTTDVPDRALASILFTDIVGSTQRAMELGDHAWRNLLETHDAISRTPIDQHHGRIVKSTGDGILATFDGPGRAIRCANALGDALKPFGLAIRAGLHTGEVEIRESDIAGIGVRTSRHAFLRQPHLVRSGFLPRSPCLLPGRASTSTTEGSTN
jgi:class 3 adenylate cyclase